MNSDKRGLTKLIGVALLILAVLIAAVLVKTRPKAQRKPMSSMVPVVETAMLQTTSMPVRVECLGTVIADALVEIQAEVKGRVVSVSSNLVAGAEVKAGDLLIGIDPRDYEQAVKSAGAALLKAQSSLRIEEGQQAVAKHEMGLIGSASEIDPAYRDLMLRTPQLRTAEAAVTSAEAALAAAQTELERTQIHAPFDAVVQSESIDVGDYAQVGRTLAELAGTARYFVRASLPVRDLTVFPDLESAAYPVRLIAGDEAEYTGTLYRRLPGLTEQGRMARVLITVDRPLEAARPLLLNEVVRAEIFGEEAENVCLVDRRNLQSGPSVWMIDPEKKLHICPVEVVQGYADQALVRFDRNACGILHSNDWKLVTSRLAAPIDGMQLKTVQSAGGEH
jgi:RND family efflux transporter MFP subunit